MKKEKSLRPILSNGRYRIIGTVPGTGRYESKTFSRSYNKMFSPAKKDGSATHGIILSNFYP